MAPEQTNFLADTFELDSFHFSKPKKYKNSEIMVCKIKNKNNEPVLVQFPKMTIVQDYRPPGSRFVELEFINETGYNKKVYNFLSKIDEHVTEYVHTHSRDWFGKDIPLENLTQMYNKFIKAPKTSDQNCTINFVFDKTRSEVIDKKNEPLDISELNKGIHLECISQMKYIVFTKDTCFISWEICTARVHKKVVKVPRFGFIEDPADLSDDDSEEESLTFF